MGINLEELEQLHKAATPGPWEVDDCYNIRIAPKGRPIVATIHDYEDYLPRMADAAYIVAVCNAVPELIARVRELERQRELLARNLAEAPWCLACQIKICSNEGKNIDPRLVDRNECKNILIRWAEEAAKEAEKPCP